MTIPWLEIVLGFTLGLAFYFVVRLIAELWHRRRHDAPEQKTLDYYQTHYSSRREK